MLLDLDVLSSMREFKNIDRIELKNKIKALEQTIRKYTNNNFQNRNIRFTADVKENKICMAHPFLRVGDTIQISESGVNDGVYDITQINSDSIIVDGDLFDVPVLVTKVEYPADIKNGMLNLLKWDVQNRDKVGIKSESLSRHSVTYYDMDVNHELGYPSSLIGFLKPYKKARF